MSESIGTLEFSVLINIPYSERFFTVPEYNPPPEQNFTSNCIGILHEDLLAISPSPNEQSKKILIAGKKHGLLSKIHADELNDTGGGGLAAEINAISAEFDSQSDDLITLDKYSAADIATAKDYINDSKNSVLGLDNRFDRNDQDVTNDLLLQLDRFFGIGVDFRSPNLLPGFIGNAVGSLFPDPTFNGVILVPDLNEDLSPADGIPDAVQ